MKKLMIIALLSFISNSYMYSLEGTINTMVYSPGMITAQNINYFTNEQDYVNGGISFTYPPGFYAAPPFIWAIAELKNLTYATDRIISTQVVSNSTSGCTIRVNVNNNGTIAEAATDDVTVNIIALNVQP